jgi:molybdenum cofactor biosynthesis enzyme MoaA
MQAYMSDHCRLSCKQCTERGPRTKGPNDKLLTVEELSKEIGKTAAPAAPAAVASPSPSPR